MWRARISLRKLLAMVFGAGILFAALHVADFLWTGLIFSLCMAVLQTSILVAIHRSGASRGFWLGFAVCGIAYFVANTTPDLERGLPIDRAIQEFMSRVVHPHELYAYLQDGAVIFFLPHPLTLNFHRICHSVLALIAGFLGGHATQAAYLLALGVRSGRVLGRHKVRVTLTPSGGLHRPNGLEHLRAGG